MQNRWQPSLVHVHCIERTNVRNALFGNDPLGGDWQAASVPDAGGYPEAILALAAAKDRLPGAVFVRVPAGLLDDERWVPVVAQTDSLCECGVRRLLVPGKGRTRLIPDNPPRVVTVTEDAPLVIAPWGGDRESAYLKFEVRYGRLLGTHAPYGPQPLYDFELPPFFMRTGRQPNETEFLIHKLQDVLRMHGENPCIQPWGGISMVVGSMVGVEVSRHTVTFELDASVITLDPAAVEPPHVCILAMGS